MTLDLFEILAQLHTEYGPPKVDRAHLSGLSRRLQFSKGPNRVNFVTTTDGILRCISYYHIYSQNRPREEGPAVVYGLTSPGMYCVEYWEDDILLEQCQQNLADAIQTLTEASQRSAQSYSKTIKLGHI
jgi:hypothetical protein